MPKPTGKISRIIRARQVLDALTQLLRRWLPLELQNTRLTTDDLLFILSFACVHRTSLESACTELASAPSSNRLREVLIQALPKRPQLQRALNTILRQQLPRILLKGKRSYALAIDLTLIPYHGQPQENDKELVRSEAKSGTTYFHGYATVAIVH
jgi:hypothetical protein